MRYLCRLPQHLSLTPRQSGAAQTPSTLYTDELASLPTFPAAPTPRLLARASAVAGGALTCTRRHARSRALQHPHVPYPAHVGDVTCGQPPRSSARRRFAALPAVFVAQRTRGLVRSAASNCCNTRAGTAHIHGACALTEQLDGTRSSEVGILKSARTFVVASHPTPAKAPGPVFQQTPTGKGTSLTTERGETQVGA